MLICVLLSNYHFSETLATVGSVNSLLTEDFLQMMMQALAAKTTFYNLSLWVDEDIVGDEVDFICRCCGTFPSLEV